MSYVDYFRPKYVVFENVGRFLTYNRGMVLQLVLSSFLEMGYQCAVNTLQAGCYGVPQGRFRTVILAAGPGMVLPRFPPSITSFLRPQCKYDSARCTFVRQSGNADTNAAPYRGITVYDALADLPPIAQQVNGSSSSCWARPAQAAGGEVRYTSPPLTTYQRGLRAAGAAAVTSHVTKPLCLLATKRIELVPHVPGADWRDLPNVEVALADGTRLPRLVYEYDDRRMGRGPRGQLRGVCACAEGRPCSVVPAATPDTLIPWCLPHTGARHNHWKGLYGRLVMSEVFATTVTAPEPMGKQGRVLHPQQDRIVSAREWARSQGFPDSFVFAGPLAQQYRQVGNAVPPPLARAIGWELRRARRATLAATQQRAAAEAPLPCSVVLPRFDPCPS